MKVEKINDRQIRCTLTREDLASRQIRLSELAYGSEKAKELFQDMMQMAAQDCGFEADNVPLMIEAIPISQDSILLIVTKVDDPDELDTRFSRFSPDTDSADNTSFSPASMLDHVSGADDIIGLLSRISEGKKAAGTKGADAPAQTGNPAPPLPEETDSQMRGFTRVYQFESLDDVIQAASVLPDDFYGSSSLYKLPEDGTYFLTVRKEDTGAEQFNRVCNLLSEYGLVCKYTEGMDAYFAEHLDPILPAAAFEQLRMLR